MIVLNLSEQKAIDILSECGINDLPTDLERIAEFYEYSVSSYSGAEAIIQSLDLQSFCDSTIGCSVKFDNEVFILYRDDLPESLKRFVIAHEIGHIRLHIEPASFPSDCLLPPIDGEKTEKEASDFALALLAPPQVMSNMKIEDVDDVMMRTGLPNSIAKTAFSNLLNYEDQLDFLKQPALVNKFICIKRPDTLLDKFRKLFLKPAFKAILAVLLILSISLISITGYSLIITSNPSADVSSIKAGNDESMSGTASSIQTVNVNLNVSQTDNKLPASTYYWSSGGTVYHYYSDCQSLVHVSEIHSGTLEEAAKSKDRLCKFCERRMKEDNSDESE